MTPIEIAMVTHSWDRCRVDRSFLRDRIATALTVSGPGWHHEHLDAADRIIETVDHLYLLLAHPAAMARAAAALVGDRAQATLAHRRINEGALLAGIEAALGGADPDVARAWRSAFELFNEILAELLLRPFGPTPADPPPPLDPGHPAHRCGWKRSRR